MSTKYVRIVRSSEAAGTSLSGEIAQAFERIRERAQSIYAGRAPDAPGSEFEDWLRAEREMFEVPEASLETDDACCRILLQAVVSAKRPITIVVEPGQVTALGHRAADGEMCLYRVVNLSDPIEIDGVRAVSRGAAGIEIVMSRAGVPQPEETEPAAAEPKTMAAAAAGGQRVFAA